MFNHKERIKVFISSACGEGEEKQKYNIARAGLKTLIESTNIADVYTFESEGASTITAGEHYTRALENCDVCIFLIDNQDKVPDGVQIKIDTAQKYGIKSLFYFCDKYSDEETLLQASLKGAKYAKSKVIHSFEEFIQNSAQDLLNDLILIFKEYCKGKLVSCKAKDEQIGRNENEQTMELDFAGNTFNKVS